MNPIKLKVQNYLERANNEAVGMPPEIMQEAADSFKDSLDRSFNSEYSDRFTLRMSNIGRPTCQLQLEKAKAPKEVPGYNFRMQMLMGDMVESAMVSVLKAADVNVEDTQKSTHIEVGENGRIIKGTYDVCIDGKIYDIKSCSPWVFTNKFQRGFDEVAKSDSFGYVAQGYGYAEGEGKPFGGWIVMNKSTGEWEVCEAPEDQKYHDAALKAIEETVDTIDSGAPFKRVFSDVPEKYRKKETGNRVLDFPCTFCPFKFHCWPGLQHKPQAASSAKNPPYRFYTKLKDEDKDE